MVNNTEKQALTKGEINISGPGERYIIIGAGPVGVRFASELLERLPDAKVVLFGDEDTLPYNRVLLTALLAGDVNYDSINLNLPDPTRFNKFSSICTTIESIDVNDKFVTDSESNQYHFDHLIFATGARPFVPQIDGIEKSGVFTFRSLKDTEQLLARTSRARHVCVMGGGLLGLEAAKAMLRNNTQVTVIQQGARLLNKQLDDNAAEVLQAKIEALGIKVITQQGVREIRGNGRVEGVFTRDKEFIECDTVILCTGISPNIELARDARIAVRNGILVDEKLNTSKDNVYAIGECCEYEGVTYGLVSPGYEQAAVLADVLSHGSAKYQGSLEVSRLKVVGEPVISMGEVSDLSYQPHQQELIYKRAESYRKIVLRKGVIHGVVAIGEWPQAKRVQEKFQRGLKIPVWRRWLFRLTGKVWIGEESSQVQSWQESAIVCQCNSISKGQLSACVTECMVANGCVKAADVSEKTGAGMVCGSCKPLIAQLVEASSGVKQAADKEIAWLPTAIASFLAILMAIITTSLPAIAVSDSVQSSAFLEFLWNDKYWKQVTGFTLLGMSLVGLVVSLRKRIKRLEFGKFAYWRFVHIFLGVACTMTLVLHTGMHFGDNLNQILMINFISVLLLGGIAGAMLGLSHKLNANQSMSLRRFFSWCHILVTWPLPVLLAIHILTVYYY